MVHGGCFRLLSVLCLASAGATAATISSFTGSFTQDDNQSPSELFTLLTDSLVTVRTFSYAGGTNGNGAVIPAGGFDTVVSLFGPGNNGPTTLLGSNDNATCAELGQSTGPCFDSLLQLQLQPGSYTVILTQHGNDPNGPTLADGFAQTGAGNYTVGLCNDASAPPFCDGAGNGRDGNWALDIAVAGAPTGIPEPGTAFLLSAPLLAMLLMRKGRRHRC